MNTNIHSPDHLHSLLRELCLPLIESYQVDLLKHDLDALHRFPDMPFLHWTRKFGTFMCHLLPPDHPAWPAKGVFIPYLFATANREHILHQNADVARGMMREGDATHTCHWWGGPEHPLRRITCERAHELATRHESAVLRAWRNPHPFRGMPGMSLATA